MKTQVKNKMNINKNISENVGIKISNIEDLKSLQFGDLINISKSGLDKIIKSHYDMNNTNKFDPYSIYMGVFFERYLKG